jgi:hypothetical protein
MRGGPAAVLLVLLACACAPGACGGRRLPSSRRAVMRPPPLPARPAHIAQQMAAAAAVPPRGSIDILTLVNASQAGAEDVSALIDAVAAQQQRGSARTLFFPGPQTYLIDPHSRQLHNWTTPAGLTLQLGSGAVLKAAPLAQVFLGGPVVAADGQIFESSPAAVRLQPNTTHGGRLTTIIATTSTPHHFAGGNSSYSSGMRFRLTGVVDQTYLGGWGATFVLSPTTFAFEIAHPPASNASATAQLTIGKSATMDCMCWS